MKHPTGVTRGNSSLELLLRTGTHCTLTGWWSPAGRGSAQFIMEGSLMPAFEGKPVVWGRDLTGNCGGSCASCQCHGA